MTQKITTAYREFRPLPTTTIMTTEATTTTMEETTTTVQETTTTVEETTTTVEPELGLLSFDNSSGLNKIVF